MRPITIFPLALASLSLAACGPDGASVTSSAGTVAAKVEQGATVAQADVDKFETAYNLGKPIAEIVTPASALPAVHAAEEQIELWIGRAHAATTLTQQAVALAKAKLAVPIELSDIGVPTVADATQAH